MAWMRKVQVHFMSRHRARSVLDLDCSEGKFLRRLLDDRQFDRIVGLDVSVQQLQRAVRGLHYDRLAPFHLLATEGGMHVHQNHVWHLETIAKVCARDPHLLLATRFKVIDVTIPDSEQEGIAW